MRHPDLPWGPEEMIIDSLKVSNGDNPLSPPISRGGI